MFLKVSVITTMRFAENNVLGPIYIDIYQLRVWAGEEGYMVHLTFFLLFIKTEKVQEHDLY